MVKGALSLFCGLLLIASWFIPESRAYLDAWDRAVFFALNGSLESGTAWQYFWAVANYRAFDLIPAALIFSLFGYHIYAAPKERSERFAQGVFIALYTVLAMQIAHLIITVDRKSPSLILEPVWRLTELIPDIRAKDASGRSLPGDHATMLMMISIFFFRFCGMRFGIAALFITVLFSTPRLVSGAHWLTDILIGSTAITLIAAPIALATPLANVVIGWIRSSVTLFQQKMFKE